MYKKLIFVIIAVPLIIISIYIGFHTHRSNKETIEYAGLTRKYRIHYPKNFNKEEKVPLVIVLHGFLTDAFMGEVYSEFSKKSDSEGFVAVYPNAHKETFFMPSGWNASFCCAKSYENNIDDVGFIERLIDEIEDNGGIDANRIYLVGISNGAMFANRLALELENRFAAVASISGAVGAQYEEDEEMTFFDKSFNPVPIMIIHGRKDPTIPFEGGVSRYGIVSFTSAYETLDFWLENNSCNKYPTSISRQTHVTHEIYEECDKSRIEFYAIDTKHTWPGSVHDFPDYFLGRSIKATDVIWDFFDDKTLSVEGDAL